MNTIPWIIVQTLKSDIELPIDNTTTVLDVSAALDNHS